MVLAQTFPVETLRLSGDTDKRINLVILSDGYQTAELPKFITDATNFMNDMISQSPFLEYADYFNVYAIKVPSNESGADHPGTSIYPLESTISPSVPVVSVDTYFNATFDSYNQHRLLYYEIDGAAANNTKMKINAVLVANNFPDYDQALILVNSPYYGGSGGEFPVSYTGVDGNEIAIHEIGHSLFDLKDEYYPGDAQVGEAINMTQETNLSLVKWKNWIGTNGIGIYPHSGTATAASWNRPHQNCKMRYLGVPFCSVCKEGIIEKIHSLVSSIDSYSPISNSISNPTFPVDFALNLIKPIPNTLSSTWTLNASNFANNVDTISLLETHLVEGTNTLTAVVHDATTLLDIDNHETIHIYTVTWNIEYSALSVNDIESEINSLSITMFPNPVNNIVNLKVESNKDTKLKIEIISLDGKKIKSIPISNYQTQQVDISNLSQGIYLTNFYANNVLIATRKLVKK